MNSSLIKKIGALVVVTVVITGSAYLLSKTFVTNTDDNEKKAVQNDNRIATHVDLSKAKSPREKLPQGFPSAIPMEAENIIESYSVPMILGGQTAVQYTVSYTTGQSRQAKYNEYLKYMTDRGFDFGSDGKNQSAYTLYGVWENDDMAVAISLKEGKTLVQISLIDR